MKKIKNNLPYTFLSSKFVDVSSRKKKNGGAKGRVFKNNSKKYSVWFKLHSVV